MLSVLVGGLCICMSTTLSSTTIECLLMMFGGFFDGQTSRPINIYKFAYLWEKKICYDSRTFSKKKNSWFQDNVMLYFFQDKVESLNGIF